MRTPCRLSDRSAKHVGDAVPHPVVAALGGPLEPHRGGEEGGQDQHDGDEGQPDVGGEEDDGDDHHGQALDGQLRQAVLEELLEVLDVAGHPAHDHAGLLLGEEAEREALQVGEDLDPEVVHHPGGQTAGDLDLEALGQRGDDNEDQVGDGRADHHGEVDVMGGSPPNPSLMAYSVSLGPTWEATAMTTTRTPARASMPRVLGQQPPQAQPLELGLGAGLAEDDVRLGVLGLGGQQLVHAVLELVGDAGEGKAGGGRGLRPSRATEAPSTAATEHHDRPPPRAESSRSRSAWPSGSAGASSVPNPASCSASSASASRSNSPAWASTSA